jgi:hypothetical protein
MKAKYSVANKKVIFVFLQNSIYVRCERFEENRGKCNPVHCNLVLMLYSNLLEWVLDGACGSFYSYNCFFT